MDLPIYLLDTLSAPSVALELGFLSVLQEAAGVLQLQLRGLGVKARVVALKTYFCHS